MTSASFALSDPSHVSAARRAGVALAERLGFDTDRAGRVGLAVTELATNVLKHAKHGELVLTRCRAGDRTGIEALALDRGPGFANLTASLEDGYSTAGSLGNGLGALLRQSDRFDAFSQHGKGAAVLSRIWKTRDGDSADGLAIGAVSLPKSGEERCGDDWSFELGRHRASVIVADGLGHGLLAAEAAAAALESFHTAPMRAPAAVLEDVHLALRATRGAAVAVVGIDFERDIALVAGLGNITGAVVQDNCRRNFVSHNGTAGHIARRIQEFSYPLPPDATIVLHSDGLSTHWNPAEYAGLWRHDPALIAGILYRDFTRGRDDATVVVLRRRRA